MRGFDSHASYKNKTNRPGGRKLLNDIEEDMAYTINLDHVAFHPGEELQEKLQEMGMTIEEFAEKSHVTLEYAQGVLACEKPITPETAVAFEMTTQISASLLLTLQHDYDNYQLKQKKTSWMEQFLHYTSRKVAVL